MFVLKTIILGMLFSAAALVAGPWLAMRFDGSFPPVDLGPLRHAGWALAAAGAILSAYCGAVVFTPGTSEPAPGEAGGALTIAGPYLYVRNPFMLGVILIIWGEALIMSRVSMVAYAAMITWAIHFWVVFYEEPALTQALGSEFTRYRKAVPRWLPKFNKYKS